MKLSVLMITYNHNRFLAQAIDSVLVQNVDFDYEIVLGEDCSTDGTREIAADYQQRFPDRIRVLYHEKNLGATKNFFETLNACRGEHVALLEGDDYWTCPDKLQKQVDFLDNHPDLSTCFHRVETLKDDEMTGVYPSMEMKPVSTLVDLLSGDFVPTCSCMFRNGLFGEPPEWVYDLSIADWPLHILNAQHGDFGFIDETMAVYRLHGGGVWTSSAYRSRLYTVLAAYDCFNKHLNFKYDRRIRAAQFYYRAASVAAEGDDREALGYVTRSILTWPLFMDSSGHRSLRLWARSFLRLLRGLPAKAGLS